MDDDDLREQILSLEVQIEELAGTVESCRKIILIFKGHHCRRGNINLGHGDRDGQVRSYGHDWRHCGYHWGHRRFRVEHEYIEADDGRYGSL
jgi:hypothetical protein